MITAESTVKRRCRAENRQQGPLYIYKLCNGELKGSKDMVGKKTAEFMIVNRRTGKALQAAGVENGQGVCQTAPTGEDAQLWAQDGGRLINRLSGKALDVVHGGVESGARAHLWEKVEDASSQQWELVKVTATYKKLLNVQSGKVLDIVDMSEEDGASAQLWDDVDGVGQQWKLVPAGESAPAKTVTKTVKKPASPKKEAVKDAAKKVEEAVKETAATVKEAVKETVAKPAVRKASEGASPAKAPRAKKAPARGKK